MFSSSPIKVTLLLLTLRAIELRLRARLMVSKSWHNKWWGETGDNQALYGPSKRKVERNTEEIINNELKCKILVQPKTELTMVISCGIGF